MKKKTVYEFNVDYAIGDDIWVDSDADCNGDLDPANIIGDAEVMKILDCNLPMLRALQMIHSDIAETIKAFKKDLIDLYEILEKLETENK